MKYLQDDFLFNFQKSHTLSLFAILLSAFEFYLCFCKELSPIKTIIGALSLSIAIPFILSLKGIFKREKKSNFFTLTTPQLLKRLNFNKEQTFENLQKISKVYLGKGYEFTPKHTRELNNLLEKGLLVRDVKIHGSTQLHCLESSNQNSVFTEVTNTKGHTIIFGTTGSGKTRYFDLLISQAIIRGDVVFIIDPKSDFDLKQKAKAACINFNRKDKFKVLDLSDHKKTNCPINLIGSSSSPTQIADKLSSLMMTNGKGADSFTAYANEALAGAVIALYMTNQSITIASVKRNMTIESYIKAIVSYLVKEVHRINDKAITAYFTRIMSGLDYEGKEDVQLLEGGNEVSENKEETDTTTVVKEDISVDEKALDEGSFVPKENSDKKTPKTETKPKRTRAPAKKKIVPMSARVKIFRAFYEYMQKLNVCAENADLEFLFTLALKDETYFSKVTAGIGPMLNALTLSNLNRILSATNGRKIEHLYHSQSVLYVALNSLKDATTGAYVGKLLLSDLSSFAGTLYSQQDNNTDSNHHNLITQSEDQNYGSNNSSTNNYSSTNTSVNDQIDKNEEEKLIKNLDDNLKNLNCGSGKPNQSLKNEAFLKEPTPIKIAPLNFDKWEDEISELKKNCPLQNVSIFVDEASEVVNEALVQLLNKSRGANFSITIATQTFADLAKRCGSTTAAMQIIGNCNTMIALRVKDEETAQIITSTLPTTTILQQNISYGVSSSESKSDITSNNSKGARATTAPLFPSSALMQLPDFEYVAKLSDGRFIKGVIPILKNS